MKTGEQQRKKAAAIRRIWDVESQSAGTSSHKIEVGPGPMGLTKVYIRGTLSKTFKAVGEAPAAPD